MSDTLAIIPTYMKNEDELEVTKKSIETLLETSDADLIVIDDSSPEKDLVVRLGEWMWDLDDQRSRFVFQARTINVGFARTVNVGLQSALEQGKHGLLVNADVEFFHNGWLDAMRRNPADVVGALLLYPNGLVQHAGIYFSVITRMFDHIYRMAPRTLDLVHRPRICPVTGALQLIKHSTLEKIGLYDENFHMGWEDVDYCHMVFQAGLQCAYEPLAEAIHHESLFRKNAGDEMAERWQRSWEYLHEKHRGHDFSQYVPTLLWDEEQ